MSAYPIRFGIQTPQQHTTWPEILSLWQEIDRLGYDTAWLFDHFLPIFSDPTGPCLEGWTALSALATATKKSKARPDGDGQHLSPSGGCWRRWRRRSISSAAAVLSWGSARGWFEQEHQEYGIPFSHYRQGGCAGSKKKRSRSSSGCGPTSVRT